MRKSHSTQRQRNKIIVKHVLSEGVWILRSLADYEFIRYPAKYCHPSDDYGTISIVDNMGTALCLLDLDWFGITWDYNKQRLVSSCEKRRFQVGIITNKGRAKK